jgi:hypothetical protein
MGVDITVKADNVQDRLDRGLNTPILAYDETVATQERRENKQRQRLMFQPALLRELLMVNVL